MYKKIAIAYSLVVLIICIIIYYKNKEDNSLRTVIIIGLITEIIGNLIIPSSILLFDISNRTDDVSTRTDDVSTKTDDRSVIIGNILNNTGDVSINTGDTYNINIPDSAKDVIPKVELDSELLELLCTDKHSLIANVTPDGTHIHWESDNAEVASVDNNGCIKAINEGTAKITATIIYENTEYTDTCDITVNNPIIKIRSANSLYIGENKKMSAITIPERVNILWSSSNTNIVTVNDNGEIEAIAEGTATITATMVYNSIDYSAYCDIEVKAPAPIGESNENINDNIKSNEQEIIDSEIINDLNEIESNGVLLTDDSVKWIKNENVYTETSQKTVREDWDDCIRFGSSNLNTDGDAYIIVACDQKYSKFTAEIAPQEGFDKSEEVVLIVYGVRGNEQISKENYPIDLMTRNTVVELDITGADELYIYKDGDYNMGKRAGQYINGYTGMGVLMRNATLHK